MKHLLILLCLTVLLSSCRGKDNKKSTSVLEDKKSLVNQWYGPNYFNEKESKKPSESLNESSDANATEIDAGGMGGASEESCSPAAGTDTTFLKNDAEDSYLKAPIESTHSTEVSNH